MKRVITGLIIATALGLFASAVAAINGAGLRLRASTTPDRARELAVVNELERWSVAAGDVATDRSAGNGRVWVRQRERGALVVFRLGLNEGERANLAEVLRVAAPARVPERSGAEPAEWVAGNARCIEQTGRTAGYQIRWLAVAPVGVAPSCWVFIYETTY